MALSRLKTRSEFLRAARGRKYAARGLVLQMWRRDAGEKNKDPRVGFTVTRRVGNAVVRNRIKRRLRAAADEVITEDGLPGRDYVLIGRAATLKRDYNDLLEDLRIALHMVHKRRASKRAAQTNTD